MWSVLRRGNRNEHEILERSRAFSRSIYSTHLFRHHITRQVVCSWPADERKTQPNIREIASISCSFCSLNTIPAPTIPPFMLFEVIFGTFMCWPPALLQWPLKENSTLIPVCAPEHLPARPILLRDSNKSTLFSKSFSNQRLMYIYCFKLLEFKTKESVWRRPLDFKHLYLLLCFSMFFL